MPGKDGLLHISQIAHERVEKVTDYLTEGQIIKVKVMETDEKGRIKLSMKALLDRPAQQSSNQGDPRLNQQPRLGPVLTLHLANTTKSIAGYVMETWACAGFDHERN